MSLNSLLESANPYQSLQSDAAKLAGKWEKTGLLEGLEGAHKNNMGIILENQVATCCRESLTVEALLPGIFKPMWVVNGQELLYIVCIWSNAAKNSFLHNP